MKKQFLTLAKRYLRPLTVIIGFALFGILVLLVVRAAITYISGEPEKGNGVGVIIGKDDQASNGKFVQFTNQTPNIVFVLLDDMDEKVLNYMPRAKSLIADQGMTFSNYYFNLAQCCPSRASMFRGQYAHNTGVLGNGPPDGGYRAFINNQDEDSTMGTWLDDAGYETAYMGKYLNGYPKDADFPDDHVPAGWDRWFGMISGMYDQYGYKVNDDGNVYTAGRDPEDYATDVLADEAEQFLQKNASMDTPLFLVVSSPSPHKPYAYAERHKNLFEGVTYPATDAFNEANVDDKPQFVQDLPLLDEQSVNKVQKSFRDRLRSVQSVDELIERLVDKLDAQGKLANTVFVITSDNGYHMGEHRLRGNEDNGDGDEPPGGDALGGKLTPYLEDIRVPLYIRGPGIPAGQKTNKIIGNVDLAPTFAALARAQVPSFVDGRNFMPVARGEGIPWRNAYLIQRWQGLMPYYGIYAENYSYVHYESGEREVYDLNADKAQNENAYGTPRAPQSLVDRLESRAIQLNSCEGQSCRNIEEQPL